MKETYEQAVIRVRGGELQYESDGRVKLTDMFCIVSGGAYI